MAKLGSVARIAGCLFAAAAAAQVQAALVEGRVSYSYTPESGPSSGSGDSISFNQAVAGGATLSIGVGAQAVDDVGASVVAQSDDGWLRIFGAAFSSVFAASPGEGRSGTARFRMEARLNGSVTIDAPGLTGTQGSAYLGMFIDGLLSAGADDFDPLSSASSVGSAVLSFGARDAHGSARGIVQNPWPPPGDINPAERFDDLFVGGLATFTFGEEIDWLFLFGSEGLASAGSYGYDGLNSVAGATAAASLVSDFGSTMTWAGVLDLRDAEGNPVTTFTAISGSGADFRFRIFADDNGPPPGTVPEPATMLLMFAGLAALSLRRGRLRHDR